MVPSRSPSAAVSRARNAAPEPLCVQVARPEGGLYIAGTSAPRRSPIQTNGFMLRGIHKASANWIGRAVMGVVLGLIAISFGIWGIGDIFRGFGTSTVAKVGGTEIRVDTFRQLYQDRLQQLGRQLNRPILPDQARALGL